MAVLTDLSIPSASSSQSQPQFSIAQQQQQQQQRIFLEEVLNDAELHELLLVSIKIKNKTN
jgi:hypothetical protein